MDAAEIVDWQGFQKVSDGPPVYENATWRLSHVGGNRLGDGSYEATPVAQP